MLHYTPKLRLENEQLQARMVELASERRSFGYRRIHALLRREGVEVKSQTHLSPLPGFRFSSKAQIQAKECSSGA
jgi:hypothetical protein